MISAEKSLTLRCDIIHPLLLNMSKAFNTSDRTILLKDLIQMKPIQINLPSQNHA